MSSLNDDRQQFLKFRGTLLIVTGTSTGGLMGRPGMPWTLVSCSRPCYFIRRTARSHSVDCSKSVHLTSSTAGAQFGSASLINAAQSPSIPPLPLQ